MDIVIKHRDEAIPWMTEYLKREGREHEIPSLRHKVLANHGKKGWGWSLSTTEHTYDLWPDGEVEITGELQSSGKWEYFHLPRLCSLDYAPRRRSA